MQLFQTPQGRINMTREQLIAADTEAAEDALAAGPEAVMAGPPTSQCDDATVQWPGQERGPAAVPDSRFC
jgi:hypothetical protein